MKIDLAAIERGRKLLRLKNHPDFAPFLEELDECIVSSRERMDSWNPTVPNSQLVAAHAENKALVALKLWIDDEIQAGSKMLERQQAAEKPAAVEA